MATGKHKHTIRGGTGQIHSGWRGLFLGGRVHACKEGQVAGRADDLRECQGEHMVLPTRRRGYAKVFESSAKKVAVCCLAAAWGKVLSRLAVEKVSTDS